MASRPSKPATKASPSIGKTLLTAFYAIGILYTVLVGSIQNYDERCAKNPTSVGC